MPQTRVRRNITDGMRRVSRPGFAFRLDGRSTTLWDIASALILILALALTLFTTRFQVIDDAYISFRYADNLMHRGELVFNPGERVEGITNLLWTLLLAAGTVLTGMPLERLSVVVSLALLVATCIRLWQMGPLLGSTRLTAAAATAMLVLTPGFVVTVINGLEGALFSALLAETLYRFLRGQRRAALLAAGLLFATRPEGLAVVASVGAVVLLGENALRRRFALALWALGPVLAVCAFRVLYYGALLPNSVVAKSFDPRLLVNVLGPIYVYFTGFAASNPHLVLLLVVSVVAWSRDLARGTPLGRRRWAVSIAVIAVLGSYVVALRNGGDWMPGYRLLSQYGVLYAVLFVALVRERPAHLLFGAALVAYPLVLTGERAYRLGLHPPTIDATPNKAFWGEVVDRLAPVLTEDDVVAAEAIGYIGYHLCDTYIHDPMGLTDPHLARHGQPAVQFGKRDLNYTLGVVRPAVAVWHWAGHLQDASTDALEHYAAFCAGECDSWEADIVMVRVDRLLDLGPAFDDWPRVSITPEGIVLEGGERE